MAENEITLETAQSWAANWRKKQPDNVKAFFIPQEDIIELYSIINKTKDMGVRGYLGIKEDGEYKLMLVAVDSDGSDMVDDGIYDMTKPCPSFCDIKSPLYTLK